MYKQIHHVPTLDYIYKLDINIRTENHKTKKQTLKLTNNIVKYFIINKSI